MKTHIIVTYTGSKIEITAEQELKLRHLGKDDKVYIDSHLVKGSNIAEVLPIETYYQNHPKERPMPEYKALKAPEIKPLTRERYINACRSTLRGIRQYIDNSPKPTPTALEIAKKIVKNIEDAKNGTGKFAKSQQEFVNQLI